MAAGGQGAERGVDLRLERLGQEAQVVVGAAAAQPPVAEWGVFVHAVRAAVGHADDDRFQPFFIPQHLHRLVHPPLAGEAGGIVEQVLSILHVDDRVMVVAAVVGRRQIDENVAPVLQLGAIEIGGDTNGAADRMAVGGVVVGMVLQPFQQRRREGRMLGVLVH